MLSALKPSSRWTSFNPLSKDSQNDVKIRISRQLCSESAHQEPQPNFFLLSAVFKRLKIKLAISPLNYCVYLSAPKYGVASCISQQQIDKLDEGKIIIKVFNNERERNMFQFFVERPWKRQLFAFQPVPDSQT